MFPTWSLCVPALAVSTKFFIRVSKVSLVFWVPGIGPGFVNADLRSQLFPQVAPCKIFGGERCLQLGGGPCVSTATNVTKEAFTRKWMIGTKRRRKLKRRRWRENYKRLGKVNESTCRARHIHNSGTRPENQDLPLHWMLEMTIDDGISFRFLSNCFIVEL